MAFTSFFRPCCINIDPYSSVSRSNSDFCICKFKLIAFLGNYSMYCIRPDPLRASKRVWLRETRATQGVPTHPTATAAKLDVLPIAPQAAPSVQQSPLPDKVKQHMVKGEYIDFDMLLPESLYHARHGVSPSPSFILRLSDDPASVEGDVVIAQQKAAIKRAIRDLQSWMEAWNVYIHVLVQHFPARAQALLAYQRIICDASVRFAPRCWLRYDQRFRASAAADKTIRWDRKHNDLWLEMLHPAYRPAASTILHQPGVHGADQTALHLLR